MKTSMNLPYGLLLAVLGLALVPILYSAKRPPSPPPPLAAPSKLTATLVAADQVRLTWQDNSSDERQFNIERSTDGFANIVTFVTRANVTQYADAGLQPGTTYYYRVRASNKTGFSDYSNVAAVTTPQRTPPPAAPSGLTAATLDTTRIHLTWRDNSTDELQFKIERSTDGFVSFVQIVTAADTTQYTDTGLQGGTAYAYRVRACNNGGCSDSSNVASANTGLVIGPWTALFQGMEHATGLTAVANSPRQVVHALRISLQAPGIRFFSSPRSLNYQPDVEETTGQTTSHWLVQHGLQAAINGNWFTPCCTAIDGAPQEVLGLAISDTVVVSEQESEKYSTAMLLTPGQWPTMIGTNWPPTNTTGINTAVAGKNPLLHKGVYVGTNILVDPRTALGITEDMGRLILMTIDGRQPSYSDGASDADTAAWMLRFGAYNAFNLDGGGSTTMAVSDGQGGSLLLNQPIHSGVPGLERAVANHLGLFALPLGVSPLALLAKRPQPRLDPEEEFWLQATADLLVDAAPHLTVTPLAAGWHRIKLLGIPDYTYRIQYTESLVVPDWQTLTTGRANELGEFDFVAPPSSALRHYRALHP